MAVNHCDTMMFWSVPFFPFFAALGVARSGPGWLAVALAPPALAVGIGVVCIGRPAVYIVLKTGLDYCKGIRRTLPQQVMFLPFVVWYFAAPWAFVGSGFYVTYLASAWLAAKVGAM